MVYLFSDGLLFYMVDVFSYDQFLFSSCLFIFRWSLFIFGWSNFFWMADLFNGDKVIHFDDQFLLLIIHIFS